MSTCGLFFPIRRSAESLIRAATTDCSYPEVGILYCSRFQGKEKVMIAFMDNFAGFIIQEFNSFLNDYGIKDWMYRRWTGESSELLERVLMFPRDSIAKPTVDTLAKEILGIPFVSNETTNLSFVNEVLKDINFGVGSVDDFDEAAVSGSIQSVDWLNKQVSMLYSSGLGAQPDTLLRLFGSCQWFEPVVAMNGASLSEDQMNKILSDQTQLYQGQALALCARINELAKNDTQGVVFKNVQNHIAKQALRVQALRNHADQLANLLSQVVVTEGLPEEQVTNIQTTLQAYREFVL